MTRTGQDAIGYARGRVGNGPPPPAGMDDSGMCLAFVRECFALPAVYGSAIDAWNAATDRHEGDRHPPAAVPLWFLSPSIFDHITFVCSASEVITTFNDDVRSYTGSDPIGAIERDFDATLLGWAPNLNGYDITAPAPPPPTPVRKDRDMYLLRIVEDGRIIYVADTLFEQVPDMDHANALASTLGPWIDVDIVTAQRIHDQVNHNIEVTADNLAGQVGAG